MSIFAGILARRPGVELPEQVVNALRANVSRFPEDAANRTECTDDGLFVVKVDIGAYGEAGKFAEDGLRGFVAGAPILKSDTAKAPQSRSDDLLLMARDLTHGNFEALRACRGQYCAVIYDRQKRALHLVVDKLGVRPIYCWVSTDYIVFATTLRIIEALSFCEKTLDMQGIAEIACLTYPLADRTAYKNIFVLNAGEVVTVKDGLISRNCYWRWDELPTVTDTYPDAKTRIYETFREAIRIRLGKDRVAGAFLSGGLDSRSIVAALRAEAIDVLTCNFARTGTQDQAFGAMVAERLGTRHTHIEPRALLEGEFYSRKSVLEWINSAQYQEAKAPRPRLLWSGDGGSVGVGHVYLSEKMVSLTSSGNIPEAIEAYLKHNNFGLVTRLFKSNIGTLLDENLRNGIANELRKLHPSEKSRTFHLFLMLNDQRRHLTNHFESLDVARVDFLLPFFDAEFVTAILREPVAEFLRHQFYLDWLRMFPAGALEVPWQAYPGHAPCPLPVPDALIYQWGGSKSRVGEKQRKQDWSVAVAKEILADRKFANKFLRRSQVIALALLAKLRLSERAYLFVPAAALHHYWKRSTSSLIN